jgi:arabinose-5-phosphate isomerase
VAFTSVKVEGRCRRALCFGFPAIVPDAKRAAMTTTPVRHAGRDPLATALATVRTEQAGLGALMDALAGPLAGPFRDAARALGEAEGRVIVTGMGKSGHVGRKIAATMASTGTPASYVHPAEASHGDLGMIQQRDVILALSWSGETRELADIIGYAHRFSVKLVAITSEAGSALGRAADVCLALPKAEEACPNGLAPTTSTTMQLVIGDALAVALLAARGFSAQDFRQFHPGGRLGAQLTFVRNVMRSGDALPIVAATMPVAEALPVMNAKKVGSLIVVDSTGRLAGMVTDGDIRRNIGAALGDLPIGDIMTRTPKRIDADSLAADAVQMLNRHAITQLVVTDDDDRPVGLVHIQDLLKLGAA